MIELKNVKKKYKKRLLFKNVNIKITSPGVYCFIGENGSGKTTILNLIGGFIKPSCGKIINKCKKICFISQKVNLLENLTVKDHFDLFSLDYNLLKKVNLFSKLNKYPRELSFGMRQRVAILIGLNCCESLVMCDEPTSHLDFYNAQIVMREIKRISKEKIVLLVSHDDNIINKYSDVIYKIDNHNVQIIKNSSHKREVKVDKIKKKRFKFYFNKEIKNNKKVNFLYFMVFFFLMFLLNLTINLKSNFDIYLTKGEIVSLDYNKFYLKECDKEVEGKVTIKKCHNLKEEKVKYLKEKGYQVSLNLDILLNYLYEANNLNIFNKENVILKEGKYPLYYNEVITDERYNIGDQIVLETTKVINSDKIDIYKNKLVLKVVGIVKNMPFIKTDKIYLNYNLVEEYLKEEILINNSISLFDYLQKMEVDDYKYVIYFEKIDLGILKENNIEYLSVSYEYYRSLEESFKTIIQCFNYITVFVVVGAFFYSFKLAKKKVKCQENDISFFKACGLNKKRIVRVVNKENNFLIIAGGVFSLVLNLLIIKIIFKEATINYCFFVFAIWMGILFNKIIFKKEIERKVSI